jgi:anti-anti-sigma regulatory factor
MSTGTGTAAPLMPRAGALATAVRAGEHACSRSATSDDRDRLRSAFIADGLARRDKVVYVRDGACAAAGADGFGAARRERQLTVLDANDICASDGAFDPERMLGWAGDQRALALTEGWDGMRVTVDMSALRGAPGPEHLVEYEVRLNERLGAGSVALLCQYDLRCFPPGSFAGGDRRHLVDISPELAAIGRTGCLAAALVEPSETLRLVGELDFRSAPSVREILHAHFHGPLRLDLGGLRHVDVSGMRALRGRKGQPLIITRASPMTLRLLELLGWDTDPAIELVASERAGARALG